MPEHLDLSEKVKNTLRRQIAHAVEDVLDSMMQEGTEDSNWRGKIQKDGIVYYEDRESVSKKQARFCCVDSTEAAVEDLIGLFVVSDTDMLLQRCRIMYDNIIDARILNVLEYPSEEHPMRSSYIRYTAFKARTMQRKNRDMCVLVSTDVIQCPDGSTVGYCVWDSLNLLEISQLHLPHGFIRTRMSRSGYFVQNSGLIDAKTKVVYIVGIEAGGLAPRLSARYYMPLFGEVLGRITTHLRSRQLDPSTFVDQSRWADKQAAEFCQCCSKHFGAVKLLDTRRYNCVSCGDVICHACHHVEEVHVSDADKTKVGICVGCRTHDGGRRLSRWSRWSTSFSSSLTTSSGVSLSM
uniref:FYVE-type domain-containing protein n=1 Tax=Hyaloperonospora arabidopsidis (strain Emoy2) TaxID=559515 RepID=M4C0X3_HYAAE